MRYTGNICSGAPRTDSNVYSENCLKVINEFKVNISPVETEYVSNKAFSHVETLY